MRFSRRGTTALWGLPGAGRSLVNQPDEEDQSQPKPRGEASTDAPDSTHSLEVLLVQAAGAQEDHQDRVQRGAGGVAQRGQAVQERNDLAPVGKG